MYQGTVVERVRGRGGAARVELISVSMVNLCFRVGRRKRLPHVILEACWWRFY
jgi:hypothetical protein